MGLKLLVLKKIKKMRATILCLLAFIAITNAAKKDDIFENPRVAEVTAKYEMRKLAAQQVANHVKVRPIIKKNTKFANLIPIAPVPRSVSTTLPNCQLSMLKS